MAKTTHGAGTAPDRLEGMVPCSKCQALNLHGAHFCAECGATLGTSLTHHRSEEELAGRRAASAALKRQYRWIAAVTWLFRLGALAYAGVTVVAIVALSSVDVPVQPGILVVVLATSLTVLMVMGEIQLLFRPFEWTLAVAFFATLVSVAHLVGPNPLGLAFYWSATWAVLFWIATGPTWRLRRLIAEHTDLYITHHASRKTRQSLEGRSAKQRHERLVRAMRRAFLRAWKVSAVAGGLFLVASGVGSWAVLNNLRPQTFPEARASFENAWNAGDFGAVDALFASGVRPGQSVWLAGLLEGHGWDALPPTLSAGEIREENERTRVDYRVGDATVSTRWLLTERRWWIESIDLPAPPLEPALRPLVDAWGRDDPQAIAGLFPPDHVEPQLEAIRKASERRGWQALPPILGVEFGEVTDRDASVVLQVLEGPVTTRWGLDADGRWGIKALRFPKL